MQTFEDGDMALLDMGAEYHFYGSDITCSFPVSICGYVLLWMAFFWHTKCTMYVVNDHKGT